MIYQEHIIEIFVNGKKLDLESQESLNLRFNNVLYNPEKIASNQAEYSFEFSVPDTPNNNRIFDYANNLSKLGKFHQRLNAQVYADGDIIFEGSLTLKGYKNKEYNCNLVSVKVYSLDEIFGDSTLSQIDWEVPFAGAGDSATTYTIDYYNAQEKPSFMFPLVCYGPFQKEPESVEDGDIKIYTSKYELDKYNQWYLEAFKPSIKVIELLKKAFEYKGYIANGTVFNDTVLDNIYMSTNLADGQDPQYNLGISKFGTINLSVNWTNPTALNSGYGQSLNFPVMKDIITKGEETETYNFEEVRLFNMMSSGDGGTVTVSGSSYTYQPNENCIVVPADGFYKISMLYDATLNTTSNLTALQKVHDTMYTWTGDSGFVRRLNPEISEHEITFKPDFKITTPLEIQLVRNYSDNIELIKGKNGIFIKNGNPDDETAAHGNSEDIYAMMPNYVNYKTCFPHEIVGRDLWANNTVPSKFNSLQEKYTTDCMYGYMPYDGDIMAYDPAVNSDFIMGATSMGNKEGVGCCSVIKNGYSWSKTYSERHNALYNQYGYAKVDVQYVPGASGGIETMTNTDYNSNRYPQAPISHHMQNASGFAGSIYTMVELKKGDILQLYGVHRDYTNDAGNTVHYVTTASVQLSIQAITQKNYETVVEENYGYNSPVDFSDKLRITNFLNKDKKISEWVQDVADAFNLEIIQNGKNVDINVKSKFGGHINTAVDIDDRVNSSQAESEMIDYPASMAVKYKIDTEEWGFEKSVQPQSKLNDPDWKDFGDSGFTVIKLNDDSYVTNTSDKNLKFSYTYYDNFNWKPVDSAFTETSGDTITLRTPVISKFSYMIDEYNYDKSMAVDGYDKTQRFWFKPQKTDAYIWTKTYPPERIQIYVPTNSWNGINLSYKLTEQSLLQRYFNITPYLSSNYVTVEAYLSPEEYKIIKNGSMIRFDSDLYLPVEIQGYDPTGENPTEIKMIKKV